MAISLNSTLRNTRATDIVTFAGSGALLRFYDSTPTLLAELTCSATLGTVSGGVLTFNAVTSAAASASGTFASASLYKSDGTTLVISGLTVGTSGTNIVMSAASVSSGTTVSISSGSITEGNA